MRLTILICLILLVPVSALSQLRRSALQTPTRAVYVRTSTVNFDNNLSASDTTVQAALDTLDDMTAGGGSVYATAGQGITITDGTFVGLQDCAANEVLKRNAGDTLWACAADSTGGGGGGNTIFLQSDGIALIDSGSSDLYINANGTDLIATNSGQIGTLSLGSTMDAPGSLQVATTLNVLGDADFGNNVSVTGNLDAVDGTFSGDVSVAGDITIAGTVDALQGTFNTIQVGATASASFRGDGDIYAASGIKAMEGLYAESVAYGAGLEISDNDLTVTYVNVIGDGTLAADTQVITDTGASFDDTYVDQFLRVIDSTPSFTGATGEIKDVLSGTQLVVSFATAGDDSIPSATGMKYVIYPHPRFFVGDNGAISASVGPNEDAKFEIHIEEGKGFHGVYIDDTAGADQHQAFTIDTDIKEYTGIVAFNSYMEASTSLDSISASNLSLEINEGSITNSHLGFIDINAIGGNSNGNDLDVIHMEGLAATDHILHAGTPDTLTKAYYDNGDGTTSDATTAFNSTGTNITLFENDNSIIYIGSTTEFTTIAMSLSTNGTRNIYPEYYYCDGDDSWKTLPSVTDTTNSERISGTIAFPNPGDRGKCDEEIDSTAFADTTDLYYIAIKRTRNNYGTQKPIENLITISGGGDYLYLDSYGLKPVGSAGAPYSCTAAEYGMTYYDSTAQALLWCIDTGWQAFAETSDITIHNNLTGIQGGTATEYYHLTSADYTEVTDWLPQVTLDGSGNITSNGGITAVAGTFGTLSASGDMVVAGTLNVGNDLTAQSDILGEGTIASVGGFYGDGSNLTGLATPSGSNNEVLTDDGAGGIVSESNLTFDGTDLTVLQDLKIQGGDLDDYLTITTANNYAYLQATGHNRVYVTTDTLNASAGFWIKGNGTGNALSYMEHGSSSDIRAYWSLTSTTFELGLYEDLTEMIINNMGYDVDYSIQSSGEDRLFWIDGGNDDIRMGDYDTNYVQISNTGTVSFEGTAKIDDDLEVTGTIEITGGLTTNSWMDVDGTLIVDSTIYSNFMNLTELSGDKTTVLSLDGGSFGNLDFAVQGVGAAYIDAPGSSLTIASGINQALNLSLTGSSDLFIPLDADSDMIIGTDMLFVDGSSGFVGAGTTIPSATLDVVGDLRVSGTMYLENGETISNNTDGSICLAGSLETLCHQPDYGSNTWRIYTTSYLDKVYLGGTSFMLEDIYTIRMGNADDFQMGWKTGGNDNMQLGTAVGNASYSGYISIMEKADMDNANRSPLATSADPVLRVYSSDATQAGDYIEMYHDQTDGNIKTGKGDLVLTSATGNVGIGIATPAVTLDVDGDLYVDGTVAIEGATNNCIITVDDDGTCDAGTAMAVDGGIAICAVCAAN